MAVRPVYGGYDYEFVGAVPDRLNCNICTKVLRDPHLAVCCGQHFCKSCLDRWFTRQGKESCPHCRAEGEDFHHVINKGIRSEINQLKITCSNREEGCQWIGELGEIETHLESDKGCDYVIVACPNKCLSVYVVGRKKVGPLFGSKHSARKLKGYTSVATQKSVACTMKRKDLDKHLTNECYLRPYQCEFCGLKDTYQVITGRQCRSPIIPSFYRSSEAQYKGHQAKCPEAPVTCPNKCGPDKIKRKDMEDHRSQCPQEPVECPFAEVGCMEDIRRHQLEDHVSTSLQQHLMLLTIDRKQLKKELNEMKAELNETKCKLSKAETEIDETNLKLCEAEARLTVCEIFGNSTNKLKTKGDTMKVVMPKFSEYRHSGKVWHSPPFYYREGYKMRLSVYANGLGEGEGTHVSVAISLLKGEHDNQLEWPMKSHVFHFTPVPSKFEGCVQFAVCQPLQYSLVNECIQIDCSDQFCSLNSEALHLVNDCLSFNVKHNGCYLNIILD